MENKIPFRRFGTMLDCSRNAVMNVPSVKRWVDILADLGYNTLMLYTEDTWEVQNQPYFGYARGRYTAAELREMDAYARSRGVELIPCIQTLAHLGSIFRWPDYQKIRDTDDILLIGDERTYQLIDDMFRTISQCFTSKTVNIGMDEAHMVGKGKYFDLHGDQNRFDILLGHLRRVSEIGRKYGLRLTMWSDMFYRLAAGGNYYVPGVQIDPAISAQIPDNVDLVYWDYYSADESRYDGMLASHENLKKGTWFAGCLWLAWDFASHNQRCRERCEAAMRSCRKNQVQDVILAIWGDNGAECSRFAALPGLFFSAEFARGITDEKQIKADFQKKYGLSYDTFCLLDLPGTMNESPFIVNASKFLLYNDPFIGLMDFAVRDGAGAAYAACGRKLARVPKDAPCRYLFTAMQALCEVLAIKAELGVRTRKVYAQRDPGQLKMLIADYKKLLRKLDVFFDAYRTQWFRDSKAFGFEVAEIRLGGLMRRVRTCAERLQELADGRIAAIEELDTPQIPEIPPEDAHNFLARRTWSTTVTASPL